MEPRSTERVQRLWTPEPMTLVTTETTLKMPVSKPCFEMCIRDRVKEVTKDMEGMLIKGVAKDTDVAVITILNVPDEPDMSFKIFGLLAQKNINVCLLYTSYPRCSQNIHWFCYAC